MLDVVQLFHEHDTVDELGIGAIRDTFADHFLPGTSTIQTRARYMLLVPWVYLELERKKVSSAIIAVKARQKEINLIYALLEADDTNGVFGRDAKKDLQRMPSSVYWAGLGAWGIRLFPGSQDQYHRYMDTFHPLRGSQAFDDDNEPVGGMPKVNWDPGLPGPPEDLYEHAEMCLSAEEAAYLQDRILIRHRDSLLAKLVQADGSYKDVKFLWEHPIIESLSPPLSQELWHAQTFSELILGASLLYNLLLAQARKHDEWIELYQNRLNSWAAMLEERWPELQAWNNQRSQFWQLRLLEYARIPHPTRSFVNEWLDLVFSKTEPKGIVESQSARSLIHRREVRIKRGRARLENPRALETWGGASGTRQLDYRWSTVSVIAADILKGLGAE